MSDYSSTAELRDEIITKINAHETPYHENVTAQYDSQVRRINDTFTSQGRGHTYRTAIFSVALNDETCDVLYFAVDYAVGSAVVDDLEGDGSVAYPVKPEQKLITVYVRE